MIVVHDRHLVHWDDGCVINLPLAGVIDAASEQGQLDKALGKLVKEIGGVQGKFANEKFLARTPEEVAAEQARAW